MRSGSALAAAVAVAVLGLPAATATAAVPPKLRVTSMPTVVEQGIVKPKKVQRHKVNLILLKGPRGRKDGTTLAELEAAVRQVDAFYNRSTGGRIRFKVGKTHRWVRSSRTCDLGVAGALADRYGWKPKARAHVVVYQAARCGFAGQAGVGGKTVLLGQGSTSSAMAHELGHNLGLGHANAATCSRAFVTACTVRKDARRATEYADLTDVMGAELGGEPEFGATAIPGTLNPALLKTLKIRVPRTTISLASLTAPRSVLLTSRTAGGYSTVSLTWAGRRVWLSYQPPRADDGSSFAVGGWYRPAVVPQVVMHAKGPGGTSLLIPRTGSSDDGAGLTVPGAYALPGGVTLTTAMQGAAVRVTFAPAA